MILNLRKFIKVSMYFFINLLIFPSKKIKQKSILIIRLDAIGDYVLFRNFIEILKKNKKYKDYKISLLGNIDWKDLSIDLDSEYIEEFFWLERKISFGTRQITSSVKREVVVWSRGQDDKSNSR